MSPWCKRVCELNAGLPQCHAALAHAVVEPSLWIHHDLCNAFENILESYSVSHIVISCAEALAMDATTSVAIAKGIEVVFTSLMLSNCHQCVKWHLQVYIGAVHGRLLLSQHFTLTLSVYSVCSSSCQGNCPLCYWHCCAVHVARTDI